MDCDFESEQNGDEGGYAVYLKSLNTPEVTAPWQDSYLLSLLHGSPHSSVQNQQSFQLRLSQSTSSQVEEKKFRMMTI